MSVALRLVELTCHLQWTDITTPTDPQRGERNNAHHERTAKRHLKKSDCMQMYEWVWVYIILYINISVYNMTKNCRFI